MTNETIKLGNTEISIAELTTMLTSESVFWALHHSVKNPSMLEDCTDNGHNDLYELINNITKDKTNDY